MVGGLDGVVVESMDSGGELVEARRICGCVGGERLRRRSLQLDGRIVGRVVIGGVLMRELLVRCG